jgi:hypothetical protein
VPTARTDAIEAGGYARLLRFLEAQPGTVITILGITIYTTLHAVYSLFYSQLGVTPEEIGLGYADIVQQAAGLVVAIVISAVSSAVASNLGIAVGNWLLRIGHRLAVTRRASSLLALLFLPPVALIIVGLKYPFALIPIPVWMFCLSRGWTAGSEARPPDQVQYGDQLTLRYVLFFTAAIIAPLLVTTPLYAWRLGRSVQHGESVRGLSSTIPILTLRAELSDVALSDGKPAPWFTAISGHCLMYLGQANNVTMLYDVQTHSSIRAPSSTVIVTVRQPPAKCP